MLEPPLDDPPDAGIKTGLPFTLALPPQASTPNAKANRKNARFPATFVIPRNRKPKVETKYSLGKYAARRLGRGRHNRKICLAWSRSSPR